MTSWYFIGPAVGVTVAVLVALEVGVWLRDRRCAAGRSAALWRLIRRLFGAAALAAIVVMLKDLDPLVLPRRVFVERTLSALGLCCLALVIVILDVRSVVAEAKRQVARDLHECFPNGRVPGARPAQRAQQGRSQEENAQ